MRFLVDECTGPALARWLEEQGHDVYSVYDQLRGAEDNAVLRIAVAEKRVLVTNDKDFGDMIYRDRAKHCGVVLLRMQDQTIPSKIAVINRLLANYAEKLEHSFVVVTENQVRFAKP